MAALLMRIGTIADSSTITTSLSSIKEFVIYRDAMNSTGLLLGHYNADLGTHYTYCSSYGTYTKYIAHGSTAPSISGGTITWPGTIGTNTHALASGVAYTWIAFGEE